VSTLPIVLAQAAGAPDVPVSADGTSVVALTSAMLAEAVRLHLQAFAGYPHTRLGRLYARALLRWFLLAPGAVALAAVCAEGRVLGYAVGAPLTSGHRRRRDLLGAAAAGLALNPLAASDRRIWKSALAWLRQRPASRTNSGRLPEPVMSLVSMAVAPWARRRRVGEQLLRAFEGKAQGLGMLSLRLCVYPDNRGARLLYEHCHWGPSPEARLPGGAMAYFKVL
jgi:ribosomal protein S18 acetylase RimI-like enzyme